MCPPSIIVFSAMFLEAFINDYGRRHKSGKYAKNYLDKIDFVSKWVLLPKLCCGNEINHNHQGFNFIANLNSLRNDMVHYKSKANESALENLDTKEYVKSYEFSFTCIEGIKILFQELNKLHPEDLEASKFVIYIDDVIKRQKN